MNPNIQGFSYKKFAKFFDHALLKPEMTEADIISGCKMARQYGIASVSVKPCYLRLALAELDGSDIAVGTVVGFPHGHSTTAAKVYEAISAVERGAVELDIVMNIGALRSGAYDDVREETSLLVDVVAGRALVKVILETHYLTNAEKIKACQLLEEAGVDFLKTSTGFAERGSSVDDVRLIRQAVSPKVQVKAAGGIRTLAETMAVIQSGATRVGTSATKVILDEFLELEKKIGVVPQAGSSHP